MLVQNTNLLSLGKNDSKYLFSFDKMQCSFQAEVHHFLFCILYTKYTICFFAFCTPSTPFAFSLEASKSEDSLEIIRSLI